MAANGILNFQGTNKATFVGASSNIVLDTVTSSLGVGVDVNGPTSNLHVVGNAYVSTNMTIAGNIDFQTITQDGAAFSGGGGSGTSPWLQTTVGTPADGIYYTAGNVAVDTNTFFVDTTNNRVGIGTTSPDSRLHIEEPTSIGATTTLFHTENGFTGGSVGHFEIKEEKHGAGTGWSDFNLRLQRRVDNVVQGYMDFNPSGTDGDYGIAFGTGATELMRIESDGNVGIGTTSPGQKLSIYTGSTTVAGLSIDRFPTGNYRSEFYQADSGLAIYVGDDTSAPTEKVRFKHNGDVGIGTIAPGTRLHVQGSSGELFRYTDGTRTVYGGCDANNPWFGTSTNHDLRIITNSNERMTIAAAGNVGIGTTSPNGKLHVSTSSGDGNSTDCLMIGGSTNCSGNTNLRIGCHNDYAWVQSHCAEPLCLNPLGNLVGIGTNSPGYTLDVTGDINIPADGEIRKGGVVQTLGSIFSTDSTKAYYTDGPVGIANVEALTTQTLQIGANVSVNDVSQDKLAVTGNVYVTRKLHAVDLIKTYEVRCNALFIKDVRVTNQLPEDGNDAGYTPNVL